MSFITASPPAVCLITWFCTKLGIEPPMSASATISIIQPPFGKGVNIVPPKGTFILTQPSSSGKSSSDQSNNNKIILPFSSIFQNALVYTSRLATVIILCDLQYPNKKLTPTTSIIFTYWIFLSYLYLLLEFPEHLKVVKASYSHGILTLIIGRPLLEVFCSQTKPDFFISIDTFHSEELSDRICKNSSCLLNAIQYFCF